MVKEHPLPWGQSLSWKPFEKDWDVLGTDEVTPQEWWGQNLWKKKWCNDNARYVISYWQFEGSDFVGAVPQGDPGKLPPEELKLNSQRPGGDTVSFWVGWIWVWILLPPFLSVTGISVTLMKFQRLLILRFLAWKISRTSITRMLGSGSEVCERF